MKIFIKIILFFILTASNSFALELRYCGYQALSLQMVPYMTENIIDKISKDELDASLIDYLGYNSDYKIDYYNIKVSEKEVITLEYYKNKIIEEKVYKILNNDSGKIYALHSVNGNEKTLLVVDLNNKVSYFAREVGASISIVQNQILLRCASDEKETEKAKTHFEKVLKKRLSLENEKREEIAEEELQRKKNKEYKDFINSPEGILFSAYKYYLIIEMFFEGRAGYQLVYINKNQFNKMKVLTKEIDTFYSKQFEKSKMNQLWKKANEEVNEVYGHVNFSEWRKNDVEVVRSFQYQLEQLHKKVFSGKIKKKSF